MRFERICAQWVNGLSQCLRQRVAQGTVSGVQRAAPLSVWQKVIADRPGGEWGFATGQEIGENSNI
jgi:hypothetical protein